MSRHRTFGELDDLPVQDGDAGFLGVDERDAAQVAPGYAHEAKNYVFRDRVAKPRRGIVALGWLNGEGLTWPWNFPVSFEYPRPIFAQVLAGAVFNDADDREWVILAGNPTGGGATQVWKLRQGFNAEQLDIDADDVPVLDECAFVQCFNKLIWMRGTQYPALEMSDVRDGFAEISQAANTISGSGTYNVSDGTEEIPQSLSALFFQNRLLVVHSRDLVAASDYLNYTRYSPTRADFRINQGSADKLVALYKFGETSLVAFKEQSVYLVENVYGDLSALRLQEVTREYGLVTRKAVCGTGTDVWFLSQKGVTSIGLALENKTQLQDARWSDPIPNTWKRINWQHIDKATAIYHDGFIYFAVPLDAAENTTGGVTYEGVNTGVLVYDTANRAWCGTHEGQNLMVRDWIKFTWLGKVRLGFVSEDGIVYLYDFTFDDTVRANGTDATVVPVETRLVTRGYTGGENGSGIADGRTAMGARSGDVKRWNRVTAVLNTWDPEFTISARVDGVNEEFALVEDKTRDRRKFFKPFGKEDFDVRNLDGRWADKYREDYSVDMTRASANVGELSGPILLGDGVNFEQHAEMPTSVRMNREGRYVQVVIENGRGRCEVKAVSVEGRKARRRSGVAV